MTGLLKGEQEKQAEAKPPSEEAIRLVQADLREVLRHHMQQGPNVLVIACFRVANETIEGSGRRFGLTLPQVAQLVGYMAGELDTLATILLRVDKAAKDRTSTVPGVS